MTQKQCDDRMMEHLTQDCYSPLKKDPTDSLSRKIDNVLKKLLNEQKIDKSFYNSCRTSNPIRPQLYGLPKIHKPGNPIRPIVSFYNTPLSSLYKQLSNIIKPLTLSPIRLKDSKEFVKHLQDTSDPNFSYYCSLDIKSLYNSCDIKKATDAVLKQFGQNPSLLPNNVTLDAIDVILHFSLDNSYLEYNNNFYRQTIGGPMGSPLTLTVALAEARVTEIETLAINSCQKPPKHYRHFVDDGFGQFTCKQHADEVL